MTSTPTCPPPVHEAPVRPAPAVPAPSGSPVDRMSARARLQLITILGSLTALGPLTIDMYLPALPSITADLQTTSAAVQFTLTGTLIGFALGQLVVGPISDSFGRRRPMMIGVALHIVASLLCAIAPNIAMLSAFRVLQGVAAAGAGVVAMAIVRDVAERRRVRRADVPAAAGDGRRARARADAGQPGDALDGLARGVRVAGRHRAACSWSSRWWRCRRRSRRRVACAAALRPT